VLTTVPPSMSRLSNNAGSLTSHNAIGLSLKIGLIKTTVKNTSDSTNIIKITESNWMRKEKIA
jgi:hypothetical protein